jgi:hypothetical protein
MAKNSKELGNLLANRLRNNNVPDVGNSQIGTANPPNPVEPPTTGGIVIPISQLGDVNVGDTITLTVTAINGDNVSLQKEETLPPRQHRNRNAAPPTTPTTTPPTY